MARKILVAYNFSGNEIQNARVHNVAGNPGTPVEGQIWYDTSNHLMKWQNNGGVIDPLARANHSGTQLAATISDFATTVTGTRLDQMAAPTAAVSLNSQRITSLADPTSAQDAATRNYVDSAVNGTDWKNSCRIASTANLSLSGLAAIDGVTPVAGDRILAKNQTTTAQNGIYVAAAGAWARSTDANTSAEVTPSLSLFVEEGSTQAGTQWRLTNTGAIVLNTTALTFAQIGAGTSYSAGSGIAISGSVISIDTAIAVRKYAQDIGDGASTSITITHGLGTLDTVVQVVEKSTGATVECDVTRGSTTQATLAFAVAPSASQYRVLVQA